MLGMMTTARYATNILPTWDASTLSPKEERLGKKKKSRHKACPQQDTHTHTHIHTYQGRNQAVGKSPQADWLLQRDLN